MEGSDGRRYVVVVDDESCNVDSNKTHDNFKGGNQEMGRRRAKQTGERERDKTFELLFNLDRVRGWSIASSLFHSFSLSIGE